MTNKRLTEKPVPPERKAHTALHRASELTTSALKSSHPDWVDPESGECPQCVARAHELADPDTVNCRVHDLED